MPSNSFASGRFVFDSFVSRTENIASAGMIKLVQNPAHPLPSPKTERWQPLRSGLINIFKYDVEEFPFEAGRLLLRGNNGAGKSRVLALQLPFLLDGELSPHRVEPDGDPAKRVEWNLLMDRHENRLGYTWIEFGRREPEDGATKFRTLGCALHARKGSGIPPNARWFFITEQRVGENLRLVSQDGFPLNRERLSAEVGPENVFATAREYRAAVDRTLFGLGDRYAPLIDLLLQLRKPQIMRDFREDDLSRLLSDALPPLPNSLIENISVSFRSLQSDRDQLEDFLLAQRSVREFLKGYRIYAQAAAKRRADDVRRSQNRCETIQRELKDLERQREENELSLRDRTAETKRIAADLAAARQSERTLLDSPEMKGAEALRHAEEIYRDRKTQLGQLTKLFDEARGDRNTAEQQKTRKMDVLETNRAQLEDFRRKTNAKAAEAAMPEFAYPFDAAAKHRFESATTKRFEAIRILETCNAEVVAHERRRDDEQRRFEDRRNAVTQCEEREAERRNSLDRVLEETAAGVYAWESTLAELQLGNGHDWRVALELWLEDATRLSPVAKAVEEARNRSEEGLNRERLALSRQRDVQTEQRNEVMEELERLRSGVQPEPPLAHTRSAEIRATLAGAPLWKLCDFHESIASEDRAGYEAALEAAGILDAWVTPEGFAFDPDTGDAIFTSEELPEAGGLNGVLVPTGEAEPVRRVLARIGAEENAGKHWVDKTGRWQHGLLRGAWRKPASQYIGHASREAARLQRIGELETQLSAIERELAVIADGAKALELRAATLRDEISRAPGTGGLQEAASALRHAADSTATARAQLEEADRLLAKARTSLEEAILRRDREADDLGLANWKTVPHVLRELTMELRTKAAELWPSWNAFIESREAAEEAVARSRQADERYADAEDRHAAAARGATEAESHFFTLQQTIGTSAAEVLKKLHSMRDQIAKLESVEKSAAAALEQAKVAIAVIEEKRRNAENDRQERETARDHAVSRLRVFVEKRLVEEASPELQPKDADLAPTRVVELARSLHQALSLSETDDETWQRLQGGINQQFGTLNDQLGMRGYHPVTEIVDEGVFAVSCAFQGRPRTMHELDASLDGEIRDREEMLSAKEREVIENHLIGEAATELQARIRAGEEWVAAVNDEMAAHPTSSGIRLRFRWEIHRDAPADLESARQQLLKMTAAWSPAEREAMGHFLQGRIDAERKADEGASMQEHLVRALDYRAWHRFAVERHQDGTWKRLTKRTYGTGSGGEKAMMLTMPQFAAAAAHYRSAHPHAPRLILLDEVFVGIDAPTRAKLMALLVNFDLDFVMTSEREWGCYPTLPALSICQLASRPGVDAVFLTRWKWNGKERRQTENGIRAL